MVGFSTNPQKETDWRPGCIQGVKNIEIKWESCLIINHSIWKSGFNRSTGIKTWTIAARNRRRSYSITGVFWGAFHIQASPPPSPPSSPSPAVSDVHKVRLSRKSWEECKRSDSEKSKTRSYRQILPAWWACCLYSCPHSGCPAQQWRRQMPE